MEPNLELFDAELSEDNLIEFVRWLDTWLMTKGTGGWLFLDGDLGAGKTTLVKAIASFYGSTTTSPTFSVINSVQTQKGKLIHGDFYRIRSGQELPFLGLEEELAGAFLACFEWPSIINEEAWENFFTLTHAPHPPWILEINIKNSQEFRHYRCSLTP